MLLYGKYMLYNNEVYDFDGRFKKMNEMTREDVMDALSLTLYGTQKAVAVVGKLGRKFFL